MKRFLLGLAAFALVMTLAACTGDRSSAVSGSTAAAAQTSVVLQLTQNR